MAILMWYGAIMYMCMYILQVSIYILYSSIYIYSHL